MKSIQVSDETHRDIMNLKTADVRSADAVIKKAIWEPNEDDIELYNKILEAKDVKVIKIKTLLKYSIDGEIIEREFNHNKTINILEKKLGFELCGKTAVHVFEYFDHIEINEVKL